MFNKKFISNLKIIRNISNLNNFDVSTTFVNRNPRNLEKLRIAYKPDGYHVDKPGKNYWHKLLLTSTGRYITATIEHYERGPVLKASTSEWPIKKNLYRYNDNTAYSNLGKILADRCLKCGITEVLCTIETNDNSTRINLFLKNLIDGGLSLKESPQYKMYRPQDQYREIKPWEVFIDE